MITKTFDYTEAFFSTLEELEPAQLADVDILHLDGFHEQGIYHSTHMRWHSYLEMTDDPFYLVRSKKERKGLRNNMVELTQAGYTFDTLELTDDLFAQFKVLYEQTTLQKERALNIDINDQVTSKIAAGIPSYIIGMFKDGKLESGLLMYVDKKHAAHITLGAKKKFTELRGGIGGLLEIELIKACQKLSVVEIFHGRSLNPAGITGSAGIFEFKARYGFSAYPEGNWITSFILSEKVTLSDLVFITAQANKLHYTVLTTSTEDITSKYRTHGVSDVTAIPLSEHIATSRAFFNLK